MHTFNLFIQSKHKTYISKFIKIFNEKSKTHLKSIKHYLQKQNARFFFSILTSPHVNKRAQEQFGTKIFKIQLKVDTTEPLKLIILLKRILFQATPNLRVKIKLKTSDCNKRYVIKDTYSLKKTIQKKIFIKTLDNWGI
jgi:ribosomal protein S10